ncbi:hypothetical protein [Aestuariirhabdus sp. LZHN29]|uniref:hypothetical protein n=1 Tax=Aestuariirhabdus sp. LZHN29 TaxID=3417462 RepID=UPI003CEA365C
MAQLNQVFQTNAIEKGVLEPFNARFFCNGKKVRQKKPAAPTIAYFDLGQWFEFGATRYSFCTNRPLF